MKYDRLDHMIRWENGSLSTTGTRRLFRDLVRSGLAWQLQGVYGRTAAAMIDGGEIGAPKGWGRGA